MISFSLFITNVGQNCVKDEFHASRHFFYNRHQHHRLRIQYWWKKCWDTAKRWDSPLLVVNRHWQWCNHLVDRIYINKHTKYIIHNVRSAIIVQKIVTLGFPVWSCIHLLFIYKSKYLIIGNNNSLLRSVIRFYKGKIVISNVNIHFFSFFSSSNCDFLWFFFLLKKKNVFNETIFHKNTTI